MFSFRVSSPATKTRLAPSTHRCKHHQRVLRGQVHIDPHPGYNRSPPVLGIGAGERNPSKAYEVVHATPRLAALLGWVQLNRNSL
ncbi:hypothetical protein SEA_WHACK_73 [Rhodococcus phage Whack]|uniref:Uncharacterized protein n=1 Tax=Rhodococcus phage Whack TaxID=2591132 RepID=A0A515MKD8_9CAUD|nr:hypothetical protein HWC40_gp73 [Rhodococcus phage Whack]QDM57136.1 hypothetical protein SEA_WHACK_73 [Rhodococcus phage Whack]